ncbi:MAG: presenilin family intramembrane aspartyl protease PSH [Halobacteriales archaeon]
MSDSTDSADDDGAAAAARGWLAGVAPQAGIGACFLATVLGGMALADEVAAADLALFADPGQVGNVGVFAVYVLVGTAGMLLAFRYDLGEVLLRSFLVVVFAAMAADAVLLSAGAADAIAGDAVFGGLPTAPTGVALAAGVAAVLWVHPEWYVIDVVGVLAGAAIVPMLGLGFGPLPVVVLLVVWAAYDAYAVYGLGHMKELAAGGIGLQVPIMFVVPTERGGSFLDADPGALTDGGDAGGDDSSEAETMDVDDGSESGGKRDGSAVTLLGLGDAVIPGMLAVSAGQFLPAPAVVPVLNANLPALGALAGGVVGLVALNYVLARFEGAHAGLPPLNAGVLAGYLVGTVAAGLPVTAALGL